MLNTKYNKRDTQKKKSNEKIFVPDAEVFTRIGGSLNILLHQIFYVVVKSIVAYL